MFSAIRNEVHLPITVLAEQKNGIKKDIVVEWLSVIADIRGLKHENPAKARALQGKERDTDYHQKCQPCGS